MVAFVSIFIHVDWSRPPLWILALAVSAVAFGALGVAIGALGRDVSTASLMAFLISLPIAFLALVPSSAVSGAVAQRPVGDLVRVPVPSRTRRGRQRAHGRLAVIGLPLLHLLALAVAFWALARLALRRFAG